MCETKLIDYFEIGSEEDVLERFALAKDRIMSLAGVGDAKESPQCDEKFADYFAGTSRFILEVFKNYDLVRTGKLRELSAEELKSNNRALYEDILPDNYDDSYCNPSYCAKLFGGFLGKMLSVAAAEVRGMIPEAYDNNPEGLCIRMELFLELYCAFADAYREDKASVPSDESLRDILYYYVADYSAYHAQKKLYDMVNIHESMPFDIIRNADLSDMRYLYYFGEYVTDNEIESARHMLNLPEETINLMADTFTEGYRIGFVVTGKDLSIKKTAAIYHVVGFERMMRRAVQNFDSLGITSTMYRAGSNIFAGRSVEKNGYCGANPNKQFDYDHREDLALVLDKKLVEKKLEALEKAYETLKADCSLHAGPAVLETFGDKPFSPESKQDAPAFSDKQQKMQVEYTAKAGAMRRKYIKEEERSFTIIDFPIPEIGDRYEEIFDEIIKINTLDYNLYRDMQQVLIETLDKAEYVYIKGMGGNKTSLKVMLNKLSDVTKETNFENCVADVNIPVGEVFTSPALKGTTGTLNVSKVYLEGLEYKNLTVKFTDGMISDYSCDNFENPDEGKKLIKDNVLFRNNSLPMGEFAIGTNTVAYVTARKYGIEDKMPILIAEKTGPHFAVGDTCYSGEEDNDTYNPDGRRIAAKDNEVTLKRKTNPEEAYFYCHTDITIPYDELGELSAVTKSGQTIEIIKNGRFVLPGTEKLNEALDA